MIKRGFLKVKSKIQLICQLRDSNAATISILWFVPQYFVMTLSEVLVSVTGVEWAYTEAPPSMKVQILTRKNFELEMPDFL